MLDQTRRHAGETETVYRGYPEALRNPLNTTNRTRRTDREANRAIDEARHSVKGKLDTFDAERQILEGHNGTVNTIALNRRNPQLTDL